MVTPSIDGPRWEEILYRHYLDAEGPNGSGPITYLDARPENLARAVQLHESCEISPEEARSSFVASFDLKELVRALDHGKVITLSDREAPGVFRYLLLTCMIPAICDDVDGRTHNFRMALRSEFRAGNNEFQSLKGIQPLWDGLTGWTEKRQKEGRAVRRIILPKPEPWKRIGCSLKLSFPSWRDRNAIGNLMTGRTFETVPALIDALSGRIGDHGGAGSLKAVYEDFANRHRNRQRMLQRHPFWVLVQEELARTASAIVTQRKPQQILEMREGLDGDVWFSLREADGGDAISGGDPRIVIDWLDRQPISGEGSYDDLPGMLHRGWLVMDRAGLGVWACDPHSEPRSNVRIVASRAGRTIWDGIVSLWTGISSEWAVSDDIDPTSASVRAILGYRTTRETDLAREVEIVGGIRMPSGSMLGRPTVLPMFDAPAASAVALEPKDHQAERVDVEINSQGLFEASPSGPLSGRWELKVQEASMFGNGLESSSIVRFWPYAELHNHRGEDDDREDEPDSEIEATGNLEIRFPPAFDPLGTILSERRADPRLVDIGEAIYAMGRRGIPEFKLLPILKRIVGSEGPSSWDVLRAFQEAGWLDVRTQSGWGARKWYIRRPRLFRVAGHGFVIDGAMPHAWREHLRTACDRIGADSEEIPSVSEFAPPMLRILDEAAGADVAAELGWNINDFEYEAMAEGPPRWPSTLYEKSGRRLASKWSWDQKRFIAADRVPSHHEKIDLSRWVRDRGDAPNIYIVSDAGRTALTTQSRTAAIIEAHRLCSRALFVFDGTGLVRTACDGFLPLPVVRALRIAGAVDSGPISKPTMANDYTYRISQPVADRIWKLLGSAIGGIMEAGEQNEAEYPIAKRRMPSGKYNRSKSIMHFN